MAALLAAHAQQLTDLHVFLEDLTSAGKALPYGTGQYLAFPRRAHGSQQMQTRH